MEETVTFNCTINEPLGHVEEEESPPSPPPHKKPSCCPVLATPPAPAMHSDLDALPIILVVGSEWRMQSVWPLWRIVRFTSSVVTSIGLF